MDIFNVLRINNVPFENLVNKDIDIDVDETLDKNSENGLQNKAVYDLLYRLYQLVEKTGYIDEYLDDIFYGSYTITYLSNGKIRLNDSEINQNELLNNINDSNRLIIKNERIEDVYVDYILNLHHLKYCECISDNLKIQNNSINVLPSLKTLVIPSSSISNVSSIDCSSYLKFCCTVNDKTDLPEIDSIFNNITFTKREPIKYYGLSNDSGNEVLNDLNYENMYIDLKNFRFYYTGNESIKNTAIKNIILSDSGNITNLINNCFSKCSNLSSINIPTSVTNLGGSCFEECKKLSSINIPTSVTNLGTYCFSKCSNLSSIVIPTSVTNLGVSCFDSCSNLSSIDIPTSIKSLGSYCFGYCRNLSSINIPTSITIIGANCFNNVKSDIHFNILASSASEANPLGNLIKSASNTPSGAKYYYYDENNDTWTEFTPS